jgi:hypothetical protein
MSAIANHFALFAPTAQQLAGLGAVTLVAIAMIAVGAAVAGRQRIDEAALVHGWAVAGTLFTVIGAASALPFTWVALGFAGLAAAALGWMLVREKRVCDPSLLRMALLVAPILLLAGNMAPSQWDEFTQWLPNARFLVEFDSLPRAGLPKSPSTFPAYPHGIAFVIYMASRLTGFLVENAGGLFNAMLLMSAGLLVARVIRIALARPDATARVRMGLGAPMLSVSDWGFCALGALAVTAFNPGFVQKIVLTAYADSATAVTLGFTAATGWMLLNAIADGAEDRARSLGWQMGLAATAMLNVKQVNLVLFLCVLAAMGLVALRDPKVPVAALLRQAARIVTLPLVVYFAWRLHVAQNIAGGEFSLRPPSGWLMHIAGDVFLRMVLIISKKGVFLALMLVAVGFAIRGLLRPRDEFDRLAVIAGTLYLGYNAFLWFAYIAAFTEGEAARAASYWRYNTHLGTTGVIFAAYGLALLWRRKVTPRRRPRLGWLAVTLILLLPVAMAHKLRFDTEKRYGYVRGVAAEVNRLLSKSDRLLAVDAKDDGQYLVIVRYAMHGSAKLVAEFTAYTKDPAARTKALLSGAEPPSHVWMHEPAPGIASLLGVQLAPGSSYLLAGRDGGWRVVKSWPHPPGPR